jgi:guanylate kinase
LRMRNAEDEMQHWVEYQHVLISDTRETDESRFRALLEAGRLRTSLWGSD